MMITYENENKNARILIVDDTPNNLKLLGTILKKEAYQVSVAKNGMQALDLAVKNLPDLILLDIMMPELDGFEICKRLKANSLTQAIPVIFLSSRDQLEDVVKGFEYGAVDYVTKPFNAIELLARINTQLKLRKAESERLQKEKLKSILEMAGAICHELVQPMQTISGLAELLLLNINPNDKTYEKVTGIRNQIDRMVIIIKKLRKITKYETKKYAGTSRIIDIDRASS